MRQIAALVSRPIKSQINVLKFEFVRRFSLHYKSTALSTFGVSVLVIPETSSLTQVIVL